MDQNCHVEPIHPTVSADENRKADNAVLAIGGMHCDNCATRVGNGLLSLEGVYGADVNLKLALAEVRYDSKKVSAEALVQAVFRAGNDLHHKYHARLLRTNKIEINAGKGGENMKKTARQTHKEARLRQRRARSVLFALVVIGVLGLAGYYLKSAFFRPPPVPLAGNVIDVAASMSGFDKTEIRVKVGQPVSIRLTSMDNSHHTDGGGKHQWAVDELAVNVVAQPESSNYVTFTPERAGSYTFYCDICCGGRANPTMNGALIVAG